MVKNREMIEFAVEKKAGLYYPKIVRGKTLEDNQAVEFVAEKTGFTTAQVLSFILCLSQHITFHVCHSFVVEVEGLGIFSPSIKSKNVSTAKELTVRSITNKGVNYRPTVKMKKKLKEAEFRRVEQN